MRHITDWHLAKAPVWRGDQNSRRSELCRAWLAVHGYLSHAEAAKIMARIENDRQQADVRWIPTSPRVGRAHSVHRARAPQGAAAPRVRDLHGEGQE